MDKYTWMDIGSSFLPGELTAAFLWAQLEEAEAITARRLELWNRYRQACTALEALGLRAPVIPAECDHNAHLFYLLVPVAAQRNDILADLNARGVNAVFHYVPLHSSPAGQRYGRAVGSMRVTDDVSSRLDSTAARASRRVDESCLTARDRPVCRRVLRSVQSRRP